MISRLFLSSVKALISHILVSSDLFFDAIFITIIQIISIVRNLVICFLVASGGLGHEKIQTLGFMSQSRSSVFLILCIILGEFTMMSQPIRLI